MESPNLSNKPPAESANISTPEQIEQERAKKQKAFETAAAQKNDRRSLGDKLLGANKLSAVDMAREEAFGENVSFDVNKRFDDERKAREASEDADFFAEMQSAKDGIWNLDRSRFKGAHLENAVHGKDSKQADKARQLAEANNTALDRAFEHEEELIRRGEWNPNSSVLSVPGFNSAEVNELKRQKQERFEKLKALQEKQDGEQKEAEEERVLKSFAQKLVEEKELIASGKWVAGNSYFRILSLDFVQSPRIREVARRKFHELETYSATYLSGQEKKRATSAYQTEIASARRGEWVEKDSYFYKIQQESRFGQFSSNFKHYVVEKLIQLGAINFQRRSTGKGRDFLEIEPDLLQRAAAILNLTPRATFDDAEKAYRKFMMKNHPDRRQGKTLDKKTEDEMGELTAIFSKLKTSN
ncbi:MAG: hypothetical protein Q7R73_05035 [bacterium]|nr:hypothetical protein [bacterium]